MKSNRLLLTLFAALGMTTLWAQKEHKIQMSSGLLSIEQVNEVSIEGHSGSEVIITTNHQRDEEEDERAKGLRIINGSGLTDNTGIGLSISKESDKVVVSSVSKNNLEVINVDFQVWFLFNLFMLSI